MEKNNNVRSHDTAFAKAKVENRGSLGVFITAGFDTATTEALLDGLVEAGVDFIELGMPFSTQWPMAPPFRQHHLGVPKAA